MFRSLLCLGAVYALAGCSAAAGSANDNPALELTGRVVDAADILDAPFEAELTRTLESLEEDTQVQLVVATTPDLLDKPVEDYSLALASAWGLGDAERNDGLLLLVAPNERKVRIDVGLGLEASVRDKEAAVIIKDDILPHFRKSDFERGIERGVKSLIKEVTPIALEDAA